jgi:hypothetical protein
MTIDDLLTRLNHPRYGRPRRSGNGWVAHCPGHDDRRVSLSVGVVNGRILINCFAGCRYGDVIAALQLRSADLVNAHSKRLPGPSREQRINYARRLWKRSRPITCTVAEKYLRQARGITAPLPRCLRFLPLIHHTEYGWSFPTLIAGVQAADGAFAAISITFLCADGSDKASVDPIRKVFGILRTGTVRLGPAGKDLVLCEGVETGLSIAQACPELAVWCALSASNLPHVAIPQGVSTVIIAADADAAGEAAAADAARHLMRTGRSVRIAHTGRPGQDFNDFRL